MAATLDNLRRVLSEDTLIDKILAVAKPDRTGLLYVCGMYVPDALVGRRPGGIALASAGDTEWISSRIAGATARIPLDLGESLYCLVPRGTSTDMNGRNIIVMPLSPESVKAVLAGTGFRVSAMAVDLGREGRYEVIDPYGGMADLREGVLRLRFPGEQGAGESTSSIRAVELCQRYSLEPDMETESLLKSAADGLKDVRPARLWGFMSRLMGADSLSATARLLRKFGVIGAILPELEKTFDIPQNYYHHLGVWDHTLEVLDGLERLLEEPYDSFPSFGGRISSHFRTMVEGAVDRRAYVSIAALIHDIGKAVTMNVEPSGRIRFRGHEAQGARLTRDIAARFGLGYRGRSQLAGLIGQHMRLGYLLKEGESVRSRLLAIRELGSRALDIALLSLADRLATRGEASSEEAVERYRRLVKRFIADYFWERYHPELASGRDVVIHAGIEPGPEVGKLLEEIRIAQKEAIITNRQQALEFMAPDFKGRIR